jgi:tellurium resistance protein TerZ
VWFRQLQSRDGSVLHTGDNRTGAGDGDDEQIKVDLSRVPADVATLVFVVNSFTGESFARIENATCRIVDETTSAEIARYDLTGSGSHTAQVMAKVSRQGSGWQMTAIGQIATGRTFQDLMPVIQRSL